MELYTTSQAAEMVGVNDSRIRQIARERGKDRVGSSYLFTAEEIEDIKARRRPGWPSGKARKVEA